MARPSRPPGFDMTYRPTEEVFGPPLSARLPALIWLTAAAFLATLVAIGRSSDSSSALFQVFAAHENERLFSSVFLAGAVLVGAIAYFLQSGMQGVRIRADGVEARELSFSVPRVRFFKWAQIDEVILDTQRLGVELWDGTRIYLPEVGNRARLAASLEKVALARAIPVRGGGWLDDLPEAGDYEEEG